MWLVLVKGVLELFIFNIYRLIGIDGFFRRMNQKIDQKKRKKIKEIKEINNLSPFVKVGPKP